MKKEELNYIKDYYNWKMNEIEFKRNIYSKLKDELNDILNNSKYDTYLTLVSIIEYIKKICITKEEFDSFARPYLVMIMYYFNKEDEEYISLEYKDCSNIIKMMHDLRYNPNNNENSIIDDLCKNEMLTSTEDLYVLRGSNFSTSNVTLILWDLEDGKVKELPLKCFKEFNRKNTILYDTYFTDDGYDAYLNLRKIYLRKAIFEGQTAATLEMKSIKNKQLIRKLDKNSLIREP